ncbi:MAG: dihydroorotase [bacterium]|nr:dihydroorotase [bacterium]
MNAETLLESETMPEMILRNGTVMTPGGALVADVAIDSGRIVAVGPDLEAGEDTRQLDCTGMWIGPGFVDVHTHLREPGAEYKEDIESGSRAAAAGGYTAVVAMPNTQPATDSGDLVRYVIKRGSEAGLVEVAVAGCLTVGRAGQRLVGFDDLWAAGVRMFSDDGDVLADAGLLRTAMDEIAHRGGVVSQHAIDPALAGTGHIHEGAVSEALGVAGIPAAAETVIVARDIELVRLTGCAYHLQHTSAAGTLPLIGRAKADGLPVTAEVTPHHLAFTDADVASQDTSYKMMPPLRTETDRRALIEGLRSGAIDIVATDHAPHADHEKDVPFEQAPNGIIGIEWAAAVVNDIVGLDPIRFFEVMSVAPARLGQFENQGRWLEEGESANIVVFDPNEATVVESSVSKSSNAPYLGRRYDGAVRLTMLAGTLTYDATAAPA